MATADTSVTTVDNTYFVESDTFSTGNISLGAGTYYLTLQNAVTVDSDTAYWEINNGPSAAYLTSSNPSSFLVNAPIPSESFDIQGPGGTVTPEPGYWALLSVAIAGLIWVKRRRLRAQ